MLCKDWWRVALWMVKLQWAGKMAGIGPQELSSLVRAVNIKIRKKSGFPNSKTAYAPSFRAGNGAAASLPAPDAGIKMQLFQVNGRSHARRGHGLSQTSSISARGADWTMVFWAIH
jgi:hypothetical protein